MTQAHAKLMTQKFCGQSSPQYTPGSNWGKKWNTPQLSGLEPSVAARWTPAGPAPGDSVEGNLTYSFVGSRRRCGQPSANSTSEADSVSLIPRFARGVSSIPGPRTSSFSLCTIPMFKISPTFAAIYLSVHLPHNCLSWDLCESFLNFHSTKVSGYQSASVLKGLRIPVVALQHVRHSLLSI